jgi:hypothetical protein
MLTVSPVASSIGSLVDASGYKFPEKDLKPGKIKLKRPSSKSAKGGKKLELHGKIEGGGRFNGSFPKGAGTDVNPLFLSGVSRKRSGSSRFAWLLADSAGDG